jgi:small subunit ribosomal protein S20
MANIRSAEKNIRKTKTRTAHNQKVLAAVESGDVKAANASLAEFASAADKAAKTHVIHRNTAARLKSRVASRLAKK